MQVNITKGQLDQKEINEYVARAEKLYKGSVEAINIEVDGEFVNLSYEFAGNVPFQRIRRITGYLVGTVDRFNDAKRNEEQDRVKHN